MPSSFANYFNSAARPMLWDSHAETVSLRVGLGASQTTTDLEGVWKRVRPLGTDTDAGQGLSAYSGEAMLVVKHESMPGLPDLPGPSAEIIREGETWALRHAERQDEWTWILHLARPDADVRMRRGSIK